MVKGKGKEEIFAGIDIGSTKVATIIGVCDENQPNIIGVGVYPTSGLRKGIVVDIEETVSSISGSIELAERMTGVTLGQVVINIDGSHVASINSRGVVAVGRADNEITYDDLVRVEEAAQAISIPSNREIIHVIPREYSVDGQSSIKDPVGMNGVRLEVEAYIITGSTPTIRNLNKCLSQTGITVENRILSPLSAAKAVLSKRQEELGVAVLDIGGGTTGIAIFEEGSLLYSSILPIGASHITNDIAIGLRTSIDIAEKVKLKYGSALLKKQTDKEKIDLSEFGGEGRFTRRQVGRIIDARLHEILQMIKIELRKINRDGMLPAGVILTGGGARLDGLVDFSKEALGLPCEIGFPKGIKGLVDKVSDPQYATSIGLLLYSLEGAKNLGTSQNIGAVVDKLRKIFKIFLP